LGALERKLQIAQTRLQVERRPRATRICAVPLYRRVRSIGGRSMRQAHAPAHGPATGMHPSCVNVARLLIITWNLLDREHAHVRLDSKLWST
jgi:hypothetical protein